MIYLSNKALASELKVAKAYQAASQGAASVLSDAVQGQEKMGPAVRIINENLTALRQHLDTLIRLVEGSSEVEDDDADDEDEVQEPIKRRIR